VQEKEYRVLICERKERRAAKEKARVIPTKKKTRENWKNLGFSRDSSSKIN
jgi:hypothetical protein